MSPKAGKYAGNQIHCAFSCRFFGAKPSARTFARNPTEPFQGYSPEPPPKQPGPSRTHLEPLPRPLERLCPKLPSWKSKMIDAVIGIETETQTHNCITKTARCLPDSNAVYCDATIGSQAAPLDGIPCMISTTPATRLHRPGTLF